MIKIKEEKDKKSSAGLKELIQKSFTGASPEDYIEHSCKEICDG